jgi:ribosomal protein S18 acetylase RimI-like enzyme
MRSVNGVVRLGWSPYGEPMSEINVRALGEEEWAQYRDVRLTALHDSPQVFVATWAQEEELDENAWRERMRRARRLIAERNGAVVGVVSLGHGEPEDSCTGELFGLWVAPEGRGTGVAWKLVEAGAKQALDDGQKNLGFWVGTNNGRAVAFASSFGFRPTGTRRPMRVTSETDGTEEMVMVLPLGDDPGTVPSTAIG